jgi:hypothetical protein
MPFFVAPMAMLYAFARDEAMRHRAGMMLDYILADFAVDTLDGLYVGAFSRVYPEPLMERSRNGSTTFAWLLFGNTEFAPDRINVVLEMPGYRPHGVALLLAISGYMPPEAVFAAGTDRSRPFVHRELKRTRQRIRYSAERSLPGVQVPADAARICTWLHARRTSTADPAAHVGVVLAHRATGRVTICCSPSIRTHPRRNWRCTSPRSPNCSPRP